MLVDDERMLLSLMSRSLQRAGYKVSEFLSAEDAIAQTAAAPDVLVTDQQLPGMTGVELASGWCAAWPELMAIVCSGLPVDLAPDAPDAPQRIRALQKPFSPDDLLAAIADALGPGAAVGPD